MLKLFVTLSTDAKVNNNDHLKMIHTKQYNFLPTVEIKGYSVMTDGRNLFDLSVKADKRTFDRR